MGKLSVEKKVCAFEWCHALSQNILSLLAGKILHRAKDFSHQKSKYMFDFWLDSVQNRIFFLLLGNPTFSKIVKEIAYIPTSFQAPFKSAIFFS